LSENSSPTPRRGNEAAAGLSVFAAGVLAGVLYSFFIFPSISRTYEAVLDPDFYGRLGHNIYAGNGLTFNPADGPTVFRGPLYPALIALSLHLTGGRYPGGVWLIQSLLHGLTCWLIFLTAARLWSRPVALTAAFAYAFYPAVLWQVPRMWNEVLLSFLVAALIFLSLAFLENPSFIKATEIGAALALLSLTKGIFLPFVIIFPLVLAAAGKKTTLKSAVLISIVAILVIYPWSVRNYRLSGRFIPVHVGFGGNLKRGNLVAREFFRSPLSYRILDEKTDPEMDRIKTSVQGTQARRDIGVDHLMLASALQDIRREPSLIIRKVVAAGLMFWYLGDTPAKSVVLLILRLPIILLFIATAFQELRAGRRRLWPAVSMVVIFWLMHLPFAPTARLSIPLLPILVMCAAAGVWRLSFLRRAPVC
jgi:4-amino-4-deoxy-L-arabinose transferase-like glycosyltransferase